VIRLEASRLLTLAQAGQRQPVTSINAPRGPSNGRVDAQTGRIDLRHRRRMPPRADSRPGIPNSGELVQLQPVALRARRL